ncbi:hypothetical protein [Frankia sp. CiP1_Cm_nod2]|uniref:hypothetical protein n=1 Tax=Frankia sp. CiP1_Cm_nod2 TaxID=2897161 RepID=UPI002024A46A
MPRIHPLLGGGSPLYFEPFDVDRWLQITVMGMQVAMVAVVGVDLRQPGIRASMTAM